MNSWVHHQWPPPGFPIVEGDYRLTREWTITLPAPMCRRIEGDAMVFWRPGLTAWLIPWSGKTPRFEQYAELRSDNSGRPDIRVVRDSAGDTVSLFAYRKLDRNTEGSVESLNAFVVAEGTYLQMSVYFDDVAEESVALTLVDSARPSIST